MVAKLARGALWQQPMQAVLGSEAARVTALDVGGQFTGSHGLAQSGGDHASAPYTVVGVLAPSGTVLDRMVVTSIESVWAVHEAHQAEPARPGGAADGHDEKPASHADDREVTLILVRYAGPVAAASLPRQLNETTNLVAASPAYETARLLSVFGVGIDLLRAFAYLLIAASALMLFVALAQALDERRYDLAILRALGAHRLQVAGVLLVESLVLSLAGTLLGLALAHGDHGARRPCRACRRTVVGRRDDVRRRRGARRRDRTRRGYTRSRVARVAGLPHRRRCHACRRLSTGGDRRERSNALRKTTCDPETP